MITRQGTRYDDDEKEEEEEDDDDDKVNAVIIYFYVRFPSRNAEHITNRLRDTRSAPVQLCRRRK